MRGVVFCEKSEEEEEVSGSESEDEEDKSSVSSDGMATNFEGKIKFRASNLPQVVATCVVSSFTESSRHPDKSSLIPTVLIDRLSYLVCLYDCESDVLLISNKKSLCTKGHLSRSGIALLWVLLPFYRHSTPHSPAHSTAPSTAILLAFYSSFFGSFYCHSTAHSTAAILLLILLLLLLPFRMPVEWNEQ